ncbi:Tim44/TimA family putative adaptor protein [Geminicoccus roseus]|uniref:Tim44/TimA family putative adaptor protein n=1 Tax=Geminicoccus roseus TaxID=404900 RepID=UPI000427E22B|nr:Tim44/TimA family putative adaptor protein [Geminicoccus roseus]
MSDGFAYIDILFFAMVAAFIAYRLRSVLGRRTGLERHPLERHKQDGRARPGEQAADADNVVALPDRRSRMEEPPAVNSSDADLAPGVAALRAADPGFDMASFLPGAKAAFGMIVDAFARGDLQALRPLLADQVFRNFKAAIDQREAAGERLETEIMAEPAAEFVEAGMRGSIARVTLRFVSRQTNVTRDARGNVIAGDPVRPEEVVDLWTFERDVRSSDPNWLLAETATPE